MKKVFNLFLLTACLYLCYSCEEDDNTSEQKIDIPEVDISDEIIGEWVYDHPEENSWQSMKFVSEGSYFCYSDNKEKWPNILKTINKGNYGVKGYVISANNGSTYLDMTVSKINGYEFTGRINETTIDFSFHKVVMRTHLTYGQSIIPPYEELVDTIIMSYKSHDESIATVDSITGEITAVANNGRTYVDIVTKGGTAVIKVMIGKVNDGDEYELSPVKKKDITPPQPILNLSKAILGRWIWDINYWESINFLENGKVYYSNKDVARGIYNDNASGDYTIDSSNNRLTLKVVPTGGSQMTVIMVINAISKYSFTAKFYLTNGESTGTFTYAKQIGSIELNDSETVILSSKDFLEEGTIINGYKSHNTSIADVDNSTGEIRGKGRGRTYIDVITEDGTAVVEVIVNKPILLYNFDEFVWSSREKVNEVFGKYSFTTDSMKTIYNISEGDYETATFTFENDVVSRITLIPKKDVSFTDTEMINVLSEQYTPYPSMTNRSRKAFLNGNTDKDSVVLIAYYLYTKQLLFTQYN